ncbi:MAG: energy transducer TonB [Bacteroidota bacterium]
MKINIPKPCHENWSNMTPNEQGRFCVSCQKTVLDFTNWNTLDIQNYFAKYYGQKICGRFNNEQLAKINIQIPSTVFSFIPPVRKFALVLFIVFGTTLFSCTDNDGQKVKINSIEVIDSNHKEEIVPIIGVLEIPKTTTPKEPIKKEIKKIQFTQSNIITGDVEVSSSDSSLIGLVIDGPEIAPEFIGGEDSLVAFIENNLTTPKKLAQHDITGKIIVHFFVETDGSITDVKILKGIGNEWDEEAVRVVKLMPKWKAGSLMNKPIKVRMTLPILIGK